MKQHINKNSANADMAAQRCTTLEPTSQITALYLRFELRVLYFNALNRGQHHEYSHKLYIIKI